TPRVACITCGQTGVDRSAIGEHASARPATTRSRRRRPRIQPKPFEHELRLLGACGKERTGFPQAGGADLSEIPYPVDPEIWKRRCMTKCCLLVGISGSGAGIRTGMKFCAF